MKRYLCGFLCLGLVIPPLAVHAEEVIPITEPIVETVVAPVAEPIVEPITEPAVVPIETPIEEPIVAPVIGQVVDPATEPAVVPIETQITEPIVEPVVAPVVETIVEPILSPIEVPIAEPLVEPIAEPIVGPISPPISSPISPPISSQLIINEVMAGTEVNPNKDVWIELYNPTDLEVLLDGWTMNGVTAGGDWVDVADSPGRAIQPKALFLISHYTDSKSSALAVKPHVQKISLLFPNPIIQIELRDPSGKIADTVRIEKSGAGYRSFERKLPPVDGTLAESWVRSAMQTNLKIGLSQTFGTPGAENSLNQPIGEVETLACSESGSDLILSWKNPASPNLASLNIYQLNAMGDGWDAVTTIQPSVGSDGQPSLLEQWLIPNAASSATAFKITTVDSLGRESVGNEIEWAPKPNIRIAEILPKPKLRESENEFVELWNYGTVPADLRGWELDNGNLEDDISYFFADEGRDYVVQPNSALVFYSNETLVSLGNLGESVYLFDSNGNEVDHFDFAPLLVGRSWGRRPENPDEWFTLGHPTPNAPNVDVNRPPVVSIKTQGGTRELTLNVTGEDSQDPDGDKMDFTWVFEPGASDNRKNPTEYRYATTGLKMITLTVTDEFGLSSSASIAFDAQMEPGGGRDESNPAPVVQKSYNAGEVVIESVLPNPNGKDAGSEKITLKSNRKETISLQGWKIENLKGKRVALGNTSISPLGRWSFRPSEVKLNLVNKGDRLTLLDPAGNRIDSIEWVGSGSGQTLFRPDFLDDGILAEVTGVVDGDTFRARIEGLPITVRLLGVDTPETVHPFKEVEKFGKEASDYLKSRLDGKTVTLSFEPRKTDKYGRLLAYVHVDGIHINAELVEKGFGIAYTRFPFKHLENFKKLEEEARQNKTGLWADPLVLSWISESENEFEDAEEPQGPLALEEKEPKPKKERLEKEAEEKKPETVEPLCPTEGLKIETILPNPKKGESVEFIRIINFSDREVCLNGWSLDDRTDGGSKPHRPKGGSLAPDAIRTFRKNETKLSLNNKDDCATLINPLGEIGDQLCYGKTHKNEQFTHAGGDWKPTARKKKAKIVKTVKTVKTQSLAAPASQPFSDYLSSLATESLTGTIHSVDLKEKQFELESQGAIVSISFAQSNIDMAMVAQMTDFASPVIAEVRGDKNFRELVTLRPLETEPASQPKNKRSVEWELALALLALVAIALGFSFKKVD